MKPSNLFVALVTFQKFSHDKSNMEVWKLWAVLFLLSPNSRAQAPLADDVSTQQLERLVMLLTQKNCEKLLVKLSTPEEDLFKRLERLDPQNNQLGLPPRKLLSVEDVECRTTLMTLLLEHGEEISYDRLARELRHIGRIDVAMEMGKNINQEYLLKMKQYVEDYHKTVSSFSVPEKPAETKHSTRVRTVQVRDLRSKDLELRVWRAPVTTHREGPLDLMTPVLWGTALGFFGTLMVGLGCVVVLNHFTKELSHPHQYAGLLIEQ